MRTAHQVGHKEMIARELMRYEISVAALSEHVFRHTEHVSTIRIQILIKFCAIKSQKTHLLSFYTHSTVILE